MPVVSTITPVAFEMASGRDLCDITRPEVVDVTALNAEGEPIQFRCGGLLARAIQHEGNDHLHGILFINRMTKDVKEGLRPHSNCSRRTKRESRRQPAQARAS